MTTLEDLVDDKEYGDIQDINRECPRYITVEVLRRS